MGLIMDTCWLGRCQGAGLLGMQARICKAAVEEHSDYEMHCHPLHYWRCLGAGARLANMVRRDPAAAAARLPAYASEAELDQELVHTMCASSTSSIAHLLDLWVS